MLVHPYRVAGHQDAPRRAVVEHAEQKPVRECGTGHRFPPAGQPQMPASARQIPAAVRTGGDQGSGVGAPHLFGRSLAELRNPVGRGVDRGRQPSGRSVPFGEVGHLRHEFGDGCRAAAVASGLQQSGGLRITHEDNRFSGRAAGIDAGCLGLGHMTSWEERRMVFTMVTYPTGRIGRH